MRAMHTPHLHFVDHDLAAMVARFDTKHTLPYTTTPTEAPSSSDAYALLIPTRQPKKADIGRRCTVTGYDSPGTIRYFGPFGDEGKTQCGVELDDAIGKHSGRECFRCVNKHGLLVAPSNVQVAESESSDSTANGAVPMGMSVDGNDDQSTLTNDIGTDADVFDDFERTCMLLVPLPHLRSTYGAVYH